jgi:hypothetical protein
MEPINLIDLCSYLSFCSVSFPGPLFSVNAKKKTSGQKRIANMMKCLMNMSMTLKERFPA